MKVFLVATEESGDRLGAALMQSLKTKLGSEVEFRGVGGYEMAAEGLPSLFRIDDLAIVGIAGITQALPMILSR
ncbi:MAG: lipid-A-disaccharide synthase, partial [Pseudorhodoplanes sp.]